MAKTRGRLWLASPGCLGRHSRSVGGAPCRKSLSPPSARLIPRYLSGEATEQDELAGVELERARNFVRLGDLLWTRSRPAAASVEYSKAHEAAPADPVVASRYARSAIAGGRPQEALAPLERTLERYPTHAPALSSLATALFRVSDFAAAKGRCKPSDRTQSVRSAAPLHPCQPWRSPSRTRGIAVLQAWRHAGVMWQFPRPGAKRSS